jgi:hypothetical protein
MKETCSMSKRLKDKIEELEQKHRVIADNLLDAIWIINAETLKFDKKYGNGSRREYSDE